MTINNLTTIKTLNAMGYYKVAHDGGTFVTGTFYNPKTKDIIHMCIRDYDYSDKSRDNDSLYYAEIDEPVRVEYLHNKGVILEGDNVEVVKGRTLPKGTVITVNKIVPFYDKYNRWYADYAYYDGGKINIKNVILKGE